jgi:hypothetical protein
MNLINMIWVSDTKWSKVYLEKIFINLSLKNFILLNDETTICISVYISYDKAFKLHNISILYVNM